MEAISPWFVAILGIGIISFVVLGVYTVMEDSRILFVGLVGQPAAFFLTKPGTNGSLLVAALFALAVIALMARVVFRNIRRPRIWVPLLVMAVTTISGVVMYACDCIWVPIRY